MSLKTLANRATAKVSKQVLVARNHSPAFLMVVGGAGMITTVVLACRATLKLSDTLAQGEEHLKKVEVTVTDGDQEVKKAGMNVRLQTAIRVAKLYAPAAVVGIASLAAITGSHVILQRRNAGLAAAYAIVDKSFKDYRKRVVEDQGAEKDLEYRFGITEKEIAEEGPNGIETRVIRGLDQETIEEQIREGKTYARIFGPRHADGSENTEWSDLPNQNQYRIQMVLNHARDMLEVNRVVFLNDVYDMLGFPRTHAGQMVGWVAEPRYDANGKQVNDTFIDFGLWSEGIHKGKEWVNGEPKAFLLDFNVDGIVLDNLEKM